MSKHENIIFRLEKQTDEQLVNAMCRILKSINDGGEFKETVPVLKEIYSGAKAFSIKNNNHWFGYTEQGNSQICLSMSPKLHVPMNVFLLVNELARRKAHGPWLNGAIDNQGRYINII